MCGIAGRFLHERHAPAQQELVLMGSAMIYRGPDDEGYFRASHIGLVHRRLSIRDLTSAGRCPMASPNGRIQVLLNGEIYNWRELRDELASRGYRFESQCDAEVLVHGFHAWREALIPRLRGMFAIAIWDEEREQLLLVRDRVGEKPLFYRADESGLDFSSTVQSLALLRPDLQIDSAAMACYLAHSFIPATHTVWGGVKVLPPGHILAIAPGREPELSRFWEFPRKAPAKGRPGSCLEALESVLEDSVRRCLDADVPVGVFLSGGVDSSLVAAMAARHQKSLPAFSLGFHEQEFSELPYARQVAAHIGVEHHEIEIGVEDLIDCLPHLVIQYGQPFGDSSAIPSYLLSRFAREHVKVCLSGDGGDESFGGYWRLQSTVYAQRYARLLPELVRENVVPRIAPLLGRAGSRWMALNELSLARNDVVYSNYESWYLRLNELAGPNLRPGLNHDLASCRTAGGKKRPEASLVQNVLLEDFQVQLPDDYLTKIDVASMAASLEVRAPMLDQKVIEEAWTLPDRTKLNFGRRKWLLKKIAKRWVPSAVIFRPKMGFALPLEHWWRGDLGDWLDELMKHSIADHDGWIRSDLVRRCLFLHRDGENHHTRLWLALWLELWFRLVVHRMGATPPIQPGPSA